MDDAIPVSTRLRRTTPYHDAYTWTPTRALLRGEIPVPATLQLCIGHRCLVFHLARADAVPEALRRFLADPRVTFVGSGSAHDGRMLWEHYGLDVARGRELRAVAGMGNASVEQMAERFLGYPGICKPREVSMSAWHAPRLSLDQVQYASVDAYLAFRLGVVLLCPGGAAPPPPPARAQQRAPVQRVPAVVNPAPRAPVVVHAAPPVQRAPAVVRQAPAPVVVQPAPLVVVRPAPPAFFGVPVPAVGANVAITSGKVMGTHAGVTDDSDTESEMDSYDDVYRAATRGLPVRAYASDSDYSLDSSDGFEDVRFGAFTDEEDEDDGSYAGTGSLAADDIDSNGDDDEEDEEGCDEDDQDDDEEEGCK
ncbi:unnamed protein product [Miscanthus lutarioriparius]|uniref:3'-5' exonuclease domain-containing protein n=1 Tax=Miscanthus lutarioriparius TaxID=422564 RepID=A0A811NT30_9POAL|nr:unnamed protein product [Miscanthus lutarioriparius]